jgi:hypothetical protein
MVNSEGGQFKPTARPTCQPPGQSLCATRHATAVSTQPIATDGRSAYALPHHRPLLAASYKRTLTPETNLLFPSPFHPTLRAPFPPSLAVVYQPFRPATPQFPPPRQSPRLPRAFAPVFAASASRADLTVAIYQ